MVAGAPAGRLAAHVVAGCGFGLIGNVVAGVVGPVVAGLLLPRIGFGMGRGRIAALVRATIGAVVLLVLIRVARRARRTVWKHPADGGRPPGSGAGKVSLNLPEPTPAGGGRRRRRKLQDGP